MARLSLVTSLRILAFDSGTITEYDAGMTNAMVNKRGERMTAVQRPAIDIFEDASTVTAKTRGRAIFRWSANDKLYIVNDDKVYLGSQDTVIGTISSGIKRCKFNVLGDNLGLLDAENNQLWTISTGNVVTLVTDTDFPPNQTPAIGLAYGLAVLDKSGYALDDNGEIYGCDLSDLTSWGALDFIEAERYPDGGNYIGRHHDNVVVFGPRSIEFFYTNPNNDPEASPLSRRADVAYTFGTVSGETVWESGDRLFFIGTNDSGALAAFMMLNFVPVPISDDQFNSFLTQTIVKDGYSVVGSGFSGGGHNFYILTFYSTPADIVPTVSLVYDDIGKTWGFWTTTAAGQTLFPLIDWTVRSDVTARFGEGIFSNGDLLTVNDNLIPYDTLLGSSYVADDYVDTGYVSETGASSTAIPVTLRTGQSDFETSNEKRCDGLTLVGDKAAASQTVTVTLADENSASFASAGTLDASLKDSLRRLGRFERRNHQLAHSSTERLELEAIDLRLRALAK